MRIGIDATPLPPQPVGAGNYIINLIRALASLDREDELVVFAQRSGSALLDLQGKPGVETVVLPDRSPAARLIWEQIAFPRLVSQKKVDLLHSLHYTRPFNLPSASVVTLHDMTFFLFPELHTRPKRIYFPMMIRLSARKSDELIADSESTRQDALSILNLPGDKIVTVPLGVSEAYRPITDKSVLAAIQQKYTLPEGFILYVGLVEPRKNIPILVRAYRQIVDRGFNQKLVIVGRKGWSYQEVLNQIDSFGLKDRIHFTGYIPQDDLPIVYNLASLFVYPSVYEGFGLPPLEAMACGTPVITTQISSMPEHVGDGGILVPPQDEDALVEAIATVLSDVDLQKKLARQGRRQAAKFTWKRTARETLGVYQRVLAQV